MATERGAEKLQKSYFEVVGLCCSSEVGLIESILNPLEGVYDVSVIVPSRTLIVLHDPRHITQLHIVNQLNKARLEANVKVYGEEKYLKKNWPSPYAIASGVLLLLSVTLKYFYHPLQFLALGAVAVGIIPLLFKALASLRNLALDINILMILAVGGSIALCDYWEAGTIVFLFTTAQWLETRASHKATAVMSSLANIVPQAAVIAETGELVEADQVELNTILAVKPGDIVPIDGIVVQGTCDVDEKTLTGESFPVSKQVGSIVWAGTINLNGYVSVETTALAKDCVVARMANLVEEALTNKSKTQRFIDKAAKYYTPIVLIVSVCIAISPAVVKVQNPSEWYHLALVVLVSACPCALILSTPVATCCALSNAAKSGLFVKGGEYLEMLSKVKIMAFDKTGTITKGEFVVSDFRPLLDDVNRNTLLYWISSIERKSSHPMAAALIDFALCCSVEPKPDEVEEFRNFPGEGVCGKIDGKVIFVGNRKIATRAGCTTMPTLENDAKDQGKSIGYIFLGSSPAGIFSLSDVCRTGVKQAINELKSMGIETVMLTGDSEAAANHAQVQLGGALELVYAELLPEDKAKIIEQFQNESPTAMIGDGINDAAALATADIGISMGISGSALAMETGNIILMSNDIRKIPQAARLARKTNWKIVQNVFLTISIKAAIVALALAGHPLVWAAVLADVGTCLLVIFNSMLLLGAAEEGDESKKTSGGRLQKHDSKTAQSHSSYSQKNCCSGTKKQDKHKPQCCSDKKCASEGLLEPLISASNKCSTSAENQGCRQSDQAQDGNCDVASPKSRTLPQKPCCSGSQAEKKCKQSDQARKGRSNVASPKPNSLSKQCCSGSQAESKCTSQKSNPGKCPSKHQLDSSSPKSSQDLKPLNSAENHSCCGHNINVEVEKHMNHETHGCYEHNDKIEVEQHKNHGSCDTIGSKSSLCGNDVCVDSIEKELGQCDEICEEKCCEHESSSTINHDLQSHHHLHRGCTKVVQQKIAGKNHSLSNHCANDHGLDYITEDELSNMIKTCCSRRTEDADISSTAEINGRCCRSRAVNARSSLERKQIGGCCKSFKRKCCSTTSNVGGGLSEIIIE